ncbi:hypothetical protein ALC57_02224 [Trachymyrmex cornetzi]|uniref:THAP-type domain-containing protein n=1 Tax=Trachymyrmex cornetzi TaxID=471704 RepID=A0A151JNU8_9HYME|nr:hypothetical protein ALC57_02224 [Trachymyrmex cornetzi]
MVECAAPFCNNSAAKDYIMKIFPRDVERRALWAINVGKNWTPTKNAYISLRVNLFSYYVMQVHFAPTMWEQRTDMRKLKPNAVPTIFGYLKKKRIKSRN